MEEKDAPRKGQNYALHSLTAIILIILTGIKFNMGLVSQDQILALGRFAMPLFFIISGYYLYSDDGHSEKALPRKAKHILFLIIFIKLFYLLLDTIYLAAGIVDLDYLITSFIICEDNTRHVWFVYALFLLYAWWWLMRHYRLDIRKISFTLSAIVLITIIMFGIVIRAFGIEDIGGTTALKISDIIYPFIGIPFFTIGYYLHMYKEEFDRRFSTPALIVISLLGLFVPVLTSFFIPSSTLYVGSIIAAIGLFMLTFRVPENRLRCRALEFAGRNLKPFLYAFFPAVVFFLQEVVLVHIEDDVAYHALGAILSIIGNILISYLFYRVLKHFGSRGRSDTA